MKQPKKKNTRCLKVFETDYQCTNKVYKDNLNLYDGKYLLCKKHFNQHLLHQKGIFVNPHGNKYFFCCIEQCDIKTREDHIKDKNPDFKQRKCNMHFNEIELKKSPQAELWMNQILIEGEKQVDNLLSSIFDTHEPSWIQKQDTSKQPQKVTILKNIQPKQEQSSSAQLNENVKSTPTNQYSSFYDYFQKSQPTMKKKLDKQQAKLVRQYKNEQEAQKHNLLTQLFKFKQFSQQHRNDEEMLVYKEEKLQEQQTIKFINGTVGLSSKTNSQLKQKQKQQLLMNPK